MDHALLYAGDLVAISLLVFGVYFPRHRRRDLVIAYLGVNVGVLVVASSLATSTVGAGLGLGLFGVLSIIRLRSTELDQHEVAYYFTALAIGLLGGLGAASSAHALVPVALMFAVVAVLYLAGHPRLLRRYRQQVMLLDRAFTDERSLIGHLEGLLAATVHQVTVQRVDLVNDTTLVDVRFRLEEGAGTDRVDQGAGAVVLPASAGTGTHPDTTAVPGGAGRDVASGRTPTRVTA